MSATQPQAIENLAKTIWARGQDIDLTNVTYGRIHWGNQKDISERTSPYYHFLAGAMAHFGFTRAFEVGTHCAGATRAIRCGAGDRPGVKIVTCDITTESDAYLQGVDGVTKLVGDATQLDVLQHVDEAFGPEGAELVFIDGEHSLLSTYACYSLYRTLLRPAVIVLDDIRLGAGMQAAWRMIASRLDPRDRIDVITVAPDVRAANCGFGLVIDRARLGWA